MSNSTGIAESLTMLRDEVRVQLHLMSMDARAYWKELETKLAAFETTLDQNGGKLSDSLATTGRELTARVEEFLKAHRKAAQ